MIRIVLDTSVLISFLLTRGHTISRIMERWESGDIKVIVSPGILGELKMVASDERIAKRLKSGALADLCRSLQKDAFVVTGELELPGVTPDPEDDMVVACAVEGEADCIVTRDHHLLDLEEYARIPILSPEEFVFPQGMRRDEP